MEAMQNYFNKVSDGYVTKHILNSTGYLLTERAADGCAEYNKLKFEVGDISHYAKAVDARAPFVGAAVSSFTATVYHVIAAVALLFAGLAFLTLKQDETILDLAVKQIVQVGSNLGFGAVSFVGIISPSISAAFFNNVKNELVKTAPQTCISQSAKEAKTGLFNFAKTFFNALRTRT